MSAQPLSARQRAEVAVRRNPTAASEFQSRLSAAIERLVDEGSTYAELSVDRLVTEAGVSRSTFYKYFGDKTGLLSSLVGAVQDDFLSAANSWLEMPSGAPRSDYRASFETIFDAYRAHRVVMRCIVEQATQVPAMSTHFGAMMRSFVHAVEQHIERGQKAGAITNTQPANELATWLTWMFEYGQMQLIGPADDRSVQRLTAAVTDIVWKTLYSGTSDG